MVNEEVTMTMSVLPGAMTGISTLMAGMVSINNVFMDVTRQIDATFGLVDATVVTTGTVVAQFGLKAAEAFGQFEQGMKIVQMVSGQTRGDIEQLSQTANQFAVQYRMDIEQLTEGLQTLGRAGLNSASEQAEVLQNGLSTAKLEGRDLNGVLEELIQNTALLGGNLKSSNFGEDSQYINDLLVGTSMTAPITTHDISETLKYSGGIAAAAGAKIRDDSGNVNEEGKAILEDYMGAIAAFAQKGVTGSIAGTALRAFFNKPATQDSSVTEALSMIHLKPEYLWEDDEETMKPVSEQIEIIQNQMDELNVSTMDRLQIWSKIVGGKMGQQMMKLDSSSIKELTRDIREAESAETLASNSMKTYQANMKQMAEQGQVAFREFGGYVAQMLNPVLSVITAILGLLSNPIVSGMLFAGFIGAMAKLYQTIRKVLTNLKNEFSMFMNFFKSGEPLMAYRPSIKRGMERKGQYEGTNYNNLRAPEEAQTVKQLTDSFKNVAGSDRLAYLRSLGLSDAQIAAQQITSKWSAKTFMPGVQDGTILNELIKQGSIKGKMLNDIFVLTPDEWRNKWKDSVGKFLDNVSEDTKELSEREEKYRDIADEYINKKSNNASKDGNIGSRDKGPDDISDENWYTRPIPGNIPSDAVKYQQDFLNNLEDQKKYQTDWVSSRLYFTRTGNALLQDMVSVPESSVQTTFSGDEFAKYHLGVNATKEAEKKVEEVDEAAQAYFDALNTELNLMLMELQNPGYKELQKRRAMFDEFYEKNSSKKLGSLGIPINKQEKVLVPPEMIRESFSQLAVPNITKEMFGQLRLSGGGTVAEMFANEKAFGGQKGFDKAYEQFSSLMENKFKQFFSHIAPNVSGEAFEYINAREILAAPAGRGPGKWSYNRIANKLNELYGIDAFGGGEYPFYTKGWGNGNNFNKAGMADRAYPYLADWSITKRQDRIAGISDAEFKEMAINLGMDPKDLKGNRQAKIDALNAHLKGKNQAYSDTVVQNWLNDYDNIANQLKEENQRLKSDIERMKQEVADLKNRRETRNALDDWDAVEEGNKRRAHHDELSRTEGKKTAERLGVKKDEETLEETQNRLHKELELQEEEKVTRERNLANQNEINALYAKSNRALQKQYESPIGPHPFDGGHVKPQMPKGFSPEEMEKEMYKALNEHTGATYGHIHPFEGDGYREFYENLLEEQEQEMYQVLNENTGSTYGQRPGIFSRIRGNLPSISNPFSGWGEKIKDSLFTTGSDSLLGTAGPRNQLTGMQKFGNAVKNVTNMMGGGFLIALEAVTLIINKIQEMYQEYHSQLKQSIDALKDAYSKRDSAESDIKKIYRDSNPDATNEEINDMVLQSYTTLYKDLTENHKDYIEKASRAAETPKNYEYDEEKDDGSTKIVEQEIDAETATQEELKKNTAALYAATAELNNALGVVVTKMSDGNWGVDSWSTAVSDALGKYSDSWGGGTTFNSAGGNFLKTASQQDENYPGYGEMAGLMLEDFKDNGDNWIKGMRTMMGNDVDFYSNIMGTHTPGDDFMRKSAHFASTEISPQENMRLQASMKNDSKTWKSLGKELAKYENKNKESYNAKKGTDRIQGLIKKLQSTLGAGFSETKILQAAYLQVAQDMFAVAQTVFVPLIQQNAVSAAQTVAGVGQVYNTTGGTGTNTYNTASIASSIAALLGTIALAQSGDAGRTQAMLGGDVDGDGTPDTAADKKLQQLALDTNSGDEFMREAIKQSQGNTTVDWIGNMITKAGMPQAGAPISALSPYLGSDRTAGDYLARIYGMTTYMTVYGMDSQSAMERIDGFIEDAKKRGVSPLAELQTLGKNWTYPGFVQSVEDAYLNSPDEEDSGSGSGGSGSGDGDKDKNQGTRKERVDLVLCNKKEIPKLNVNLFKKPPTFTVLNKNFKLRDVKINTEDKPKAIMASIKNAFIDVQKRSDPKIIQDEEAEYDPVAATDGNSVPSGSSRTGTNQ